MYDREKGVYPEGLYMVGRDIPTGNYILSAKDGKAGSLIIYPSYSAFKEQGDEFMSFRFDDDFHISFMEENSFIEVENASMQKI